MRLARNLAKGEDKGFINGTGVGMTVGILCDNGGADVGIATTALAYDDVIGLYFSLKPDYREKGVWLMNDKTALALRTMKDKDGNYVWNHANDTILGKKVYISNEMPDIAAGQKPIAFGDFSFYSIVDRAPISVSVLTEKFSTTEKAQHQGKVEELQQFLDETKEKSLNADHFLSLLRKYIDIHELDVEIIREFVERINVFQAEKVASSAAYPDYL